MSVSCLLAAVIAEVTGCGPVPENPVVIQGILAPGTDIFGPGMWAFRALWKRSFKLIYDLVWSSSSNSPRGAGKQGQANSPRPQSVHRSGDAGSRAPADPLGGSQAEAKSIHPAPAPFAACRSTWAGYRICLLCR